MDQDKQLQTKDSLQLSLKLLNNYLSIYKQGGLVVTGKEKVSLPSIIKEGSHDVKNMVREGHFDTVVSFYLLALKELWMNCDNTFTNDSITSCSILLINTYPNWHPKELIVVIRNGLAAAYGKTYGKVNTDKVMSWAKEYDEIERAKYFEDKDKKSSHEIGWNEMNPDLLKKIFKPENNKSAAVSAPTYVPREKTPQEQLIQDYLRDFDKDAFESGGKRWVSISVLSKSGQPIIRSIDIDEYLTLRIENKISK